MPVSTATVSMVHSVPELMVSSEASIHPLFLTILGIGLKLCKFNYVMHARAAAHLPEKDWSRQPFQMHIIWLYISDAETVTFENKIAIFFPILRWFKDSSVALAFGRSNSCSKFAIVDCSLADHLFDHLDPNSTFSPQKEFNLSNFNLFLPPLPIPSQNQLNTSIVSFLGTVTYNNCNLPWEAL